MCNIYVTYLNMYLFICHFVYYQMINPLPPMPFLWLVSPYTLHFLGHNVLFFPFYDETSVFHYVIFQVYSEDPRLATPGDVTCVC